MALSNAIFPGSAVWPQRSSVTAVVVAAASGEQFFPETNIDVSRDRQYNAVFVDSTQTRVIFRVYSQGKKYLEVILARFAAGNEPFTFDVAVPAQQIVTFSFQDPAGTGIANANVQLGYKPDPATGM